jgi:2-polyprenyl-3-methyl-5-hydroxy-6-metoxy-1,4-benzoquinol methylase
MILDKNMGKDTRHNYEYDVELDGNTAPAEVVRMVGSNKRVLEIGAGPGSITKHLYDPGKCHITALERDGEAIKKLTPYCDAVYQADLNDASWPDLLNKDTFDVIVAADVLEHLYNPWATLEQMKSLLRDDGYIVVSLPHVGHCGILACLINGDLQYRDWGLLDKTHIRFFGIKNIM